MNVLVLLILACIFGIAFMVGKWWSYDRNSDSRLNDDFRIFYILIDSFKDIIFIFFVLKFLLYGV